ncbi:hypothetical protein [uncultured Sphingomonas sp.]|uniref:hypothetical protein n=1 Tax=uncultured Sphingomonas sp. TaxID=158754 RepID=UPI0025F3B3AD|nr:hypothetical protein [uncultured Sphingomonas sp.]
MFTKVNKGNWDALVDGRAFQHPGLVVLLAGISTDRTGLSRPRVYEGELAEMIGPAPPADYCLPCVASVILHDDDPYDMGASVAVAVVRKNGSGVVAGYFSRAQARRYRTELARLNVPADASVACYGQITGGWEVGTKKKWIMPYSVSIEISWPLAFRSWTTADFTERSI